MQIGGVQPKYSVNNPTCLLEKELYEEFLACLIRKPGIRMTRD